MQKRDLAILLLSVFAVYFSIQNEGAFYFRKAWYHYTDDVSEGPSLPSPLIADLNGDGSKEIIVATRTSRIQIITPKPPGHVGEGFAEADVIADVSLVPPGWPDYMKAAKQAIAMRNGFLDAKPLEAVRALRKQVLVVVLADWTVICFDHNLQRMWQTTVKENVNGPYGWASVHAHVREVGILISNYTVQAEDKGMVIIGGSIDLGDLEDDDTLEAELNAEAESLAAHTSKHDKARKKDTINANGVDLSRHFSYYALDGRTGQERWKHDGMDFHRDVADLAEQIVPQHHYRLTAKALEGQHYTEVACKEYRESILGILPHRWDLRDDTELKLAHFVRHREAQQEKSSSKGKSKGSKSPKAALQGQPPPRHGLDHSNPITKLFGQAAVTATKGRGVPVQSPDQIRPYTAPNVVIAHLEEGIEAVDLLTGKTLCKLYLPPGGLHTDLNADGVLDHIQAVGRTAMGETHGQAGHTHSHSCWVNALSGIPPHIHFFNGSICASHNGIASLFGGLNNGEATGPLQVTIPAVLPTLTRQRSYRHGSGTAVFLNSRGEMTAYDHNGEQLWQHGFNLGWETWGAPHDAHSHRRVVPTLRAIPLRWGGIPNVILASGASHGAIVSGHGKLLDDFKLPAGAILPLIPEDFDNNGLTDIVLVSHRGVFGYAQLRRPGGVPFSALLAILIVAMIWVYATHQGTSTVQKKGRSTDRVD